MSIKTMCYGFSPVHGLRCTLALLLVAITTMHIAHAQTRPNPDQKHPDVVSAKVRSGGTGVFDFDVTVSSPYDTAQRYADAFRVSSREGVVYGERKLLHDHAGEQPFTRDLHGVRIPAGVKTVVVQARDRKYGYGGKTAEVRLPGR